MSRRRGRTPGSSTGRVMRGWCLNVPGKAVCARIAVYSYVGTSRVGGRNSPVLIAAYVAALALCRFGHHDSPATSKQHAMRGLPCRHVGRRYERAARPRRRTWPTPPRHGGRTSFAASSYSCLSSPSPPAPRIPFSNSSPAIGRARRSFAFPPDARRVVVLHSSSDLVTVLSGGRAVFRASTFAQVRLKPTRGGDFARS